MGKTKNIPIAASCLKSAAGEIKTDSPNKGKLARARLWHKKVSRGYRTDYEPADHLWIEVHVEGQEDHAYQYSGDRLNKAFEDFETILKHMGIETETERMKKQAHIGAY